MDSLSLPLIFIIYRLILLVCLFLFYELFVNRLINLITFVNS